MNEVKLVRSSASFVLLLERDDGADTEEVPGVEEAICGDDMKALAWYNTSTNYTTYRIELEVEGINAPHHVVLDTPVAGVE